MSPSPINLVQLPTEIQLMIISQLSHAEKQLLRGTNLHFNHLIPPQNAFWQLTWIEASVYNFKDYLPCGHCEKLYPRCSYIPTPPDSQWLVRCGVCNCPEGLKVVQTGEKIVRGCLYETKVRRRCGRLRIRGEREELVKLRRRQGLGRGFWEREEDEDADEETDEETEWCPPYPVPALG